MRAKEAMNAMVHWICGEDDDMKRQLTPQLVRRIFKRMSQKVFMEGKAFNLTVDDRFFPEEIHAVGHPLISIMYKNGRRLAGRKGRKAKARLKRR